MDIEELQNTLYGIDILNEPIIMSKPIPDTSVLVTSRHGQHYQCTYPNLIEQERRKEEEEKAAVESGVLELLKPMEKGPCLIKTKDWWTYELCYGKFIRQYHMEDGKAKGNIIFLGHFESDFDWNNDTLKAQKESHAKSKKTSGRYHSQYYTNGSKCDLTGDGRRTEVRFLCDEGSNEYIGRIEEPETCVYTLYVYTSRLCSHPDLKPPSPRRPVPITCSPLLTEDQYTQYQLHIEAQRQEEAEAKSRIKAAQELLEKERTVEEAAREEAQLEDGLTSSFNSILKKSLGKEIKMSSSHPATSENDIEADHSWREVKDLENLEKLLVAHTQGILQNMDMTSAADRSKATSNVPDVKESPTEQDDASSQIISNDNDDEKSDLKSKDHDRLEDDINKAVDEFEKELKNLHLKQVSSQKHLTSVKERVKNAVMSRFKDIIHEAEKEVGAEMDKEIALQQLASSLNILMEKLEKTEKEISEIDKDIKDITTSEYGEKEKKFEEEETKHEENKDEDVPEDAESRVQAPPTTTESKVNVEPGTEQDRRDLWKVRVRTIRQDEVDNKDSILHDKQQQILEKSVKSSLEKAGVDTGNVKVQVKIISANYMLDDDENSALFSEEESASFQNLIVAILGGSNEAELERKHQAQLEKNYNFIFSKQAQHKDQQNSVTMQDGRTENTNEQKTTTVTAPTVPERL